MRKIYFVILTFVFQQTVFAQCNSGAYTVTGNSMITGSCTITGDLTIQNGATLNVDLTGTSADTFIVRGNILLEGNGVLWIHSAIGSTNDQFIVSNDFNSHRTIITRDSSRIQLENIEFRTQEGGLVSASSIYMNYDAEDNSTLYVDKCWLNGETAWLLFNLKNKATLIAYNPVAVPTEIYVQDSAQVSLHGTGTDVGLWVNFESITDTLTLPTNVTQPFNWTIGRGAGGLSSGWYVEIDSAKVGLGAQIFPSSNVTINGTGTPATGELKVALMFANNTDTLENLQVGLQNTTIPIGTNGSITLNNVNLGPIAWQIYALMNENLYIKNSIINEMGIAGPSQITADSSLFQLAVLAAVGVGGSSMTINNSEIWNQAITASNNSSIVLNNCMVTGSAFSTTDPQSDITVNGGCFFENGAGCDYSTMVNIATGQPNCNPFIPPGFPRNLTPATVTFNGVNSNCTLGLNQNQYDREVVVFPNPANNLINVKLGNPNNAYLIQMYSMHGQLLIETVDKTELDLSSFNDGIYFLIVNQENIIVTTKVIKQ
ncbi:MAG: T9SS type A sorting domain-containing protein [Bacteroidia bacterium]